MLLLHNLTVVSTVRFILGIRMIMSVENNFSEKEAVWGLLWVERFLILEPVFLFYF